MRQTPVLTVFTSVGLLWVLGLSARSAQTVTPGSARSQLPRVQSISEWWWDAEYGSGNWLGARDILQEEGVTLRVEWKAIALWNVDGGLEQRFGYNDEYKFIGNI
ncbi:MAG TPA: hypothetical protein VIT23_17900, partial [Terrimicrobiaceae bacterium]